MTLYFILFLIGYIICAIGVGKALFNGYDQSQDVVIFGTTFWPITLVVWAFGG